MRIQSNTKLDFDDVLLVPQRSSLTSRADVQVSRVFKFHNSGITREYIPIIVSNMDTTGTFEIAKAVCGENILVSLHKYYTEFELSDFFAANPGLWNNVFITVGLDGIDKLNEIIELTNVKSSQAMTTIPLISLDAANGYTTAFVDSLVKLRKSFPESVIMAGNVVTGNMVEELLMCGADIVKCGIGCGSPCSTREKAAVGVPQLSAIDECAFKAHGLSGYICADGGIRSPGDASKAIAAGADFIMCGGMFAGVDECEGTWIVQEGDGQKKWFRYYGLASEKAQEKYNGGVKDYCAVEGKDILVEAKGPAKNVVREILGGIRSCCTYSGAKRIKDLPKCAEFVRVTRA